MPAGPSSAGPFHGLRVRDLVPNRFTSKVLLHVSVINFPTNLCHINCAREGGDVTLHKHASLSEHVLPVHLKHCEEKSTWYIRKGCIVRPPGKGSRFALFWLLRDKLLPFLSEDVILSKLATLFTRQDGINSFSGFGKKWKKFSEFVERLSSTFFKQNLDFWF